ncbi:hypothetical protein ABIE12_003887 [Serratia sp. 509]
MESSPVIIYAIKSDSGKVNNPRQVEKLLLLWSQNAGYAATQADMAMPKVRS